MSGQHKYRHRPEITVTAHQAESDGVISTLEGDMAYVAGDYIVTGTAGEQWPVKAEIFRATYEEVEE